MRARLLRRGTPFLRGERARFTQTLAGKRTLPPPSEPSQRSSILTFHTPTQGGILQI